MTFDWWTLGFQTLNVIALIWLLERFFWRPVTAIIETRRAAVQKTLADAQAKEASATAALAQIEATRGGFAKERQDVLAAARDAAETAGAERVAQADKAIVALQAGEVEAEQARKSASEAAWAKRSNQLALAIAQRLAARLEGPAVSAAFLAWLLKSIEALPPAVREAASDASFEAVSAEAIAPKDQQRYRELIGKAFAGQPTIAFTADPALIAGIELRGAHVVVNNSWRADLARIGADLAHADGS
jgi:F-type H+-transporting ATPase subunit b